jgi:pyruvate dehydrogenase E2 component (dihydrolipoamide acetyltransferase)
MADFRMPILGADMQEGTLVAWLKQPGDAVEKGEIIAEVETDKAIVQIESMYTGVVERLLVEVDSKVPVGGVLAVIQTDEPEVETASAPAPAAAPPPSPRASAGASAAGRLRVSPVAQKLADEKGLDLTGITGSGPGGRIMLQDVETLLAGQVQPSEPVPEPAANDRATRMRRGIAASMSRSHREIPHFHVASVIDMSRAIDWLTEANTKKRVAERVIYSAVLVKAVALALQKTPELNAVWSEDHLELKPDVHVGVAISLPGGGLVAPAIHNTQTLSLSDLMASLRDLVRRARAGNLRSSEMTDPTITITNLGELGAESVLGLIYPPQVALVGFGRLTERPWVVEGRVEPRKVIHASLAGDHRAIDGYKASLYLAELDQLLQEPEKL